MDNFISMTVFIPEYVYNKKGFDGLNPFYFTSSVGYNKRDSALAHAREKWETTLANDGDELIDINIHELVMIIE